MAPLNDAKLRFIWRGIMRFLSNNRLALDVNKDELYDAVALADIFVSTNESSLNSAFPQPFRDSAEPWLKMLVYVCIFAARYSPDDEVAKQFLQRVLTTGVE